MPLSERTRRLLAGGEGIDVDYKTSVTQDLNDLLVAFANAEGGIVLFGVEDAATSDGRHIGRVVGIEVSDRTRGRIQSRADQTHDRIDIEIEDEQTDDGLGVYVVTVKEGTHKPYCSGGGRYLVRRDGQNALITPTMMERFIAPRLRSNTPAHQVFLMDELRAVRDELAAAMRAVRQTEPPFYKSHQGAMYRETDLDHLAADCPDPELGATLATFVKLATRFADEWFAVGKRLPKGPGRSPHSLAPRAEIEATFMESGGRELKVQLESTYKDARKRMDGLLGRV